MLKLNRKQAVWAGILLLAFAAVKIAALLWWQSRQPAVTSVAESACNVHAGCTLPNGAQVKFSSKVAAKAPFDITLRNVPAQTAEVFVSFSMRGMDMGFNRYKLLRRPDGSWAAPQIRLPVCVQNRRDYLADIHIGGEVFQVGFTAE
ncbi:hypothetical protein E4T99_08975 [Neisseria sp. WF04]|nr:hypothetical protein E4T99_08975 [Neisseria sp. WF04]